MLRLAGERLDGQDWEYMRVIEDAVQDYCYG